MAYSSGRYDPATTTVMVLVLVFVAIILLLRKKIVFAGSNTTIAELPVILDRLEGTRKDGNFAAFMFVPPGRRSPKEAVNLQFSLEQDRLGLDWVLLAPANIEDKERFAQFATVRGYQVMEREMNDVKYLRVEEGGDLQALGTAVICELYAMAPESPLDLISEGFPWP